MVENISKKIIPSGSYYAGKGEKIILEAYLGTCTGVTLVSRGSGVGGLLHILLPEPSGGELFGRPESYASTGLPLFIEEVRKLTKTDDLVATVAGGALVGPVSDLDLNLDIGGRTYDIVERILSENNIPVIKSETGGYFSCCLSLDLSSMETRIEPVRISEKPNYDDFVRPTSEHLESVIADVAPIPQIVLKVLRMLQYGRYNMDSLAGEIKQDQIISAKILRLCSSPYFHKSVDIDSIDRAVVILGEKNLLEIVISASMENYFSKKAGGYSLCKGGLFRHAVGTAIICEKLCGYKKTISGDLAYTAGLLHDIGKVALDQYMNVAYPMFYRRTQEYSEDLIKVERELFGLNHTEAGSRLAEEWGLPGFLADVIRHHHEPDKCAANSELVHLVYVADLIMSRFVVGQELERLDPGSLEAGLEKIGIRPEQFQTVIEDIAEIIHKLSS